jgi:transcriptional regulator with XRE-family HTH domain
MSDDPLEHTRDPLIRAFGAVLRAHREEAGLSRAQLAEALGCSPQWIEKLETGKKPSKESAIDQSAGRSPATPPGFGRYAELERQATTIRKLKPC